MMKKLACVLLFSLMATNTFAMPEYRAQMQERLKNEQVSFSFKSGLSVGTALRLLQDRAKGVNFIFDVNVNQNTKIPLVLENSNCLVILETALQRANLKYVVVSPNTIKILPK